MIPVGILAATKMRGAGPGPDGPDPMWDNVTSLLRFEGADGSTAFIDERGFSWAAQGDAHISAERSMFGSTSGRFDGSGDYLTAPASDISLGFTSRPFTIEWQLYVPQGAGDIGLLFSVSGSGITVDTVGGAVRVGARNIATNVATSSIEIPTNEFFHLAVERASSGGDVSIYINGALVGQGGYGVGFASGSVQLGAYTSVGKYMNGYIDQFRVTDGVARYAGEFTPPSQPFPGGP